MSNSTTVPPLNVKNRTLFIADNLDILRGINDECIDLIYLDPPFNTSKQYKAPIGSPAEGAEFKDIWTDEDIKHEWHACYRRPQRGTLPNYSGVRIPLQQIHEDLSHGNGGALV